MVVERKKEVSTWGSGAGGRDEGRGGGGVAGVVVGTFQGEMSGRGGRGLRGGDAGGGRINGGKTLCGGRGQQQSPFARNHPFIETQISYSVAIPMTC